MRKTLLLADDSVTIRRVIEQTFADEPIDVVTVSDGAAAIARLDAEPPDVVLADIGMPAPDGYELALHVRRTPALAHIPVHPADRGVRPGRSRASAGRGVRGGAREAVRSADAHRARAAAARGAAPCPRRACG